MPRARGGLSKSDQERIGPTCVQGQDSVLTHANQQTLGTYFVHRAWVQSFIHSDQETMGVSGVLGWDTQCPQTEPCKHWAPSNCPVLWRFQVWKWTSGAGNYGLWSQQTLHRPLYAPAGHRWVGGSLTDFRTVAQGRLLGVGEGYRPENALRGV